MASLIDLSTIGIGERNPNAFNDPEMAHGWNDLLKILEAAHTVDAVEVVRCRYCKYYVKFESSLIGEVMCCTGQGSVNIQKQPDDFCSCGKRKDSDGNG